MHAGKAANREGCARCQRASQSSRYKSRRRYLGIPKASRALFVRRYEETETVMVPAFRRAERESSGNAGEVSVIRQPDKAGGKELVRQNAGGDEDRCPYRRDAKLQSTAPDSPRRTFTFCERPPRVTVSSMESPTRFRVITRWMVSCASTGLPSTAVIRSPPIPMA